MVGFSAGGHLALQGLGRRVARGGGGGGSGGCLGNVRCVLIYPSALDVPPDDATHALATMRETPRWGGEDASAPRRAAQEGDGEGPGEGRARAAFYVVGSTNDKICPPESNADAIVQGLRELGFEVAYQRGKLGPHGFGLLPEWTAPCEAWIRRETAAGSQD